MKSTTLKRMACLTVALWLCPAVTSAQSLPNPASLLGGGLVEPAPPRPGDALLTCIQIAKEMETLMRARRVRLDAGQAPAGRCSSANPVVPRGARSGGLLAQVGSTMQALNDPRLMRLAQLAQAKQCTDLGPEPSPENDCEGDSGMDDRAAPPDPFKRSPAATPPTTRAAPARKAAAPKAAAPAPAAPASNNDPFRPANGTRRP